VEHAKREPPLDTGDLILVEFHRIYFPAPVLVVLGVRSENAGEQDTGAASERMYWLNGIDHDILLCVAAMGSGLEAP
jgi:hypothetical protein